MTIITFGCVASTQDFPSFTIRARFIALLDILGMGVWSKQSSPNEIARTVNAALADALSQASCGSINGKKFGPLIMSSIFSDSIFLYSPDVSWASLYVLCSTVNTLLGLSLSQGVPLRGAISCGDLVIDRSKSLFVGKPLYDAAKTYKHMKKKYGGVGVQVTSNANSFIVKELLHNQTVPIGFQDEDFSEFWAGECDSTHLLIRHLGEVFVNEWSGPFFSVKESEGEAKSYLRECFFKRALYTDKDNEDKFEQTWEFLRTTRFIPKTIELLEKDIKKHFSRSAKGTDRMEAESFIAELLRLHEIAVME